MPSSSIGIISSSHFTPKILYTETRNDTVDATTFTFSNVNFGTPEPNRNIFIFISTNRGIAEFNTFSSVTIAGTSATLAVKRDNVGTLQSGIYYAAVPTGSSGTVVVTMTSSAWRCSIIVMQLNTYSSITATSTNSAGANSATPITTTVNTVANGLLLGFVSKRIDTPTLTTGINTILATGYSEDYGFQAGYTFPTTAVTGQTVGTSYTVSSQSQLIAAALTLS